MRLFVRSFVPYTTDMLIRCTAFIPSFLLPANLTCFYKCACRPSSSQQDTGYTQARRRPCSLIYRTHRCLRSCVPKSLFEPRVGDSAYALVMVTTSRKNELKLASAINRLGSAAFLSLLQREGRQPSLAAAFRLSDRCDRQSGAAATDC